MMALCDWPLNTTATYNTLMAQDVHTVTSDLMQGDVHVSVYSALPARTCSRRFQAEALMTIRWIATLLLQMVLWLKVRSMAGNLDYLLSSQKRRLIGNPKFYGDAWEEMPLGNQKTVRLPVFTNRTGSQADKASPSPVLLQWLCSVLHLGTNTGSGVGLCYSHILKHLELSQFGKAIVFIYLFLVDCIIGIYQIVKILCNKINNMS